MSANTMKVKYHIYMEAEDISQTRIISATSFVKQRLEDSSNALLREAELTDETDLDDFCLRLYINMDTEVEAKEEDAGDFVDAFLDLIEAIAPAQSFMEMEGSCMVEIGDKKEEFTFTSEAGDSHCDYDSE